MLLTERLGEGGGIVVALYEERRFYRRRISEFGQSLEVL